jgi:predicted RNA-binding protein with PIN domain
VIAERGYDPLRDVMNSPDSVFCSHGAGVAVPWDRVEQFMHLPLRGDRKSTASGTGGSVPAVRPAAAGYRGTAEEDEALRIIFEKTYGPAKSRQLLAPVPKEAPAESAPAEKREPLPEREILLIDGYNVLFAWEEFRPLLPDHFDAARTQLTDLMCDYAGMTGKDVILVFDAYKVAGGTERIYKYHNIDVIFTREAETADQYIEKAAHELTKQYRVTVATSDAIEQVIIFGAGALRLSAANFGELVREAQAEMKEKYLTGRTAESLPLKESIAEKLQKAMEET